MPYQPFPVHHPEPPDDTIVWRYMDFPKLVAMLTGSALFFPAVGELGDPFEGSITRAMFEHTLRVANAPVGSSVIDGISIFKPAPDAAGTPKTPEEVKATYRYFRDRTFVNCWHANERESVAMWQLYAPSGYGIAVRSTVGRLKRAVDAAPQPIHVIRVEYIDYETEPVGNYTALSPYATKRRSFEHEHEIRAIIPSYGSAVSSPPPTGLSVPTRLDVLIEQLHISPRAPEWYAVAADRVVSLLNLPAGLVQHSALNAEPLI